MNSAVSLDQISQQESWLFQKNLFECGKGELCLLEIDYVVDRSVACSGVARIRSQI